MRLLFAGLMIIRFYRCIVVDGEGECLMPFLTERIENRFLLSSDGEDDRVHRTGLLDCA